MKLYGNMQLKEQLILNQLPKLIFNYSFFASARNVSLFDDRHVPLHHRISAQNQYRKIPIATENTITKLS